MYIYINKTKYISEMPPCNVTRLFVDFKHETRGRTKKKTRTRDGTENQTIRQRKHGTTWKGLQSP